MSKHRSVRSSVKSERDTVTDSAVETEPEGTAQKYIFLVDKQELGKILEQFILRFEREPKNDPE